MEIKNNNIVITGGAQGLGFAMAEKFASLGANIALIDMQQDILDTAVSALAKYGTKVQAYVANVTDEDAVVTTFNTINNDFGHIGVLINNAGILRDGMFIKAKEG